jgi:hypothetical protein
MNLAMPVLLFTFAKTTYRTASPKAPFVDISDLPFSISDINDVPFSSRGVVADPAAPLFPAARSARGMGSDGFAAKPMTTRAADRLIARCVTVLKLDPNVTVHSLRVTALTPARERGSDIIDSQDTPT